MAQDANNLIWVDMEMSGLQPDSDRVLEIALLVSDAQLKIVGEGLVLVVHQPDAVLDAMDDWNRSVHGRSGLTERVRASRLDEAEAETLAIGFLSQHVPERVSPMCGNSICQDRRFLARWMPRLERYFHYRNLDVSTLKELCARWRPELASGFSKSASHRALIDIRESIAALRYYRRHFLRVPG